MIKNKCLTFFILVPFTCGYFITCLFRTINAVQAPYIMQTLHISANSMGLLTSIYFLAFAIAQLPIGLMLDKYGPIATQTVLFIIAGIGTLIFAFGWNVTLLAIARFIIGIGVSGGLMAALKANSYWFKDKLALMNGLVMAFGGLGAYVATQPSEILINIIGWRAFNVYLSILIFIISLIIFFLTPHEYEKLENKIRFSKQIIELVGICKSSFFWSIAPITIMTLGLFTALQGLWAGSWLQIVNNMSTVVASFYLSIISIAFIAGIFFSGLIGNVLVKKGIDLKSSIIIFSFVCLIFQVIILNSHSVTPYIAWFGYSFFAQFCTLSYTAIALHYPKQHVGRAMTAINLLVFLAIFVIQYFYGLLVYLVTENLKFSPVTAQHFVFGFFVILQAVSLFWLFFKRKMIYKV